MGLDAGEVQYPVSCLFSIFGGLTKMLPRPWGTPVERFARGFPREDASPSISCMFCFSRWPPYLPWLLDVVLPSSIGSSAFWALAMA